MSSNETSFAALHTELDSVLSLVKETREATDNHYKDLHNHFDGVKASDAETRAKVNEQTAKYAELVATTQALDEGVKEIRKMLDSPIHRGGSDLVESDRNAAIELQRRAFIHKGGIADEFKVDLENLVNAEHYRSAVRKMVTGVGIRSKMDVINSFTVDEKRAFDAASLGSNFFVPEMLGITVDCDIECASLLDLYGQASVNRSMFMYPRIVDYGDIGAYTCDAVCDAEFGEPGNIEYLAGKTYDWRGVFCFNRKVLTEANYDLLSFMVRAAARSYRINRNNALITGDGVNQPVGWMSGNGFFPKIATSVAGTVSHTDIRKFLGMIPREYGNITAVMHQNMFALVSALIDADGKFIFGTGELSYMPENVRESIRISNCLPDATQGGTIGNAADGITGLAAGDFIMAAAAWDQAYYAVSKRGLWFEQWEGQSSAWCVKYQFGAEDGGFIGCPNAGRILVAQ